MNHIAWFSIPLILLLLALVALILMLVRFQTEIYHSQLSKFADFQSMTTEALAEQTQLGYQANWNLLHEMKQTLTESSKQQLSVQVGLMSQLLNQQEVLVNRLLVKDPISAQTLDSRLMNQSYQSEEYVPMTDSHEAQIYADYAKKHGNPYAQYEHSDTEHQQDLMDSGLPL